MIATNYIINIHTNESIYNAKQYMLEYKALLDDYNLDIGIIGRFFEKLFGTPKYRNIELRLQEYYGLTYSKALEILYDTHNEEYVFNPFE